MSDFYRDMMLRERARLTAIRQYAREAIEYAIQSEDEPGDPNDVDCLISARTISRLANS